MTRPERFDQVDAALDAERRAASDARLPPALRARILAATRRAKNPPPRARLVDLALRAAAVAAGVVAGLTLLPTSLEAAEFDAQPLVEWNARLADAVATRLPMLDAVEIPDVPSGGAWSAAAAAVVLVAAGFALLRREARR